MLEQKSFFNDKPTLYVVSTPIGNLKDITFRAVEILSEVYIIFAEDTRVSAALLKHYKINKAINAYHDFNKEIMNDNIIKLLSTNKSVALISDAGTPGISDPGFEIINMAISHGFNVVSIPGASAILAALVTSGLLIQPFTFVGFLPRKNKNLSELLSKYKNREETLVIYESPLRVKGTLKTLFEHLGNRKLAISRELTKLHESIIRTDLRDAITLDIMEKGEFVLVIEGATTNHVLDIDVEEHLMMYLKQGFSKMDAIKKVAKDRGVSKSVIYDLVGK